MFGFNGLAVVGSLGYGQGPLTAHNVTHPEQHLPQLRVPLPSIKNGTAASGSNVKVLGNTFLDTSSDPNQGSNGTALVLNSVSGATISGNFFDRNWGANVSCEYDQNLTITNNTFSHPNFIRPPLATRLHRAVQQRQPGLDRGRTRPRSSTSPTTAASPSPATWSAAPAPTHSSSSRPPRASPAPRA